MSTPIQQSAEPSSGRPPPTPMVLLKTYTPDPESQAAKRRRRLIAVGLSAFCLLYGFFFAFFVPYQILVFTAPPIVVAMLAIWALPEVRNPPVRTLEYLFFAVLLSLTLWPDYLAIALPGLPWITVARLFAFPMALLFLICLSISKGFRSEMWEIMSGSRIVTGLILTFTVNEVLSIIFSHEKGQTLGKIIIAQVMFTGVFLVGVFVFEKKGRVIRFASMVWGAVLFICFVSLIEFKLQHVPWVGHIPKLLQINDPSVLLALKGQVRAGVGRYRIQGIFSHPSTLAEFLAMSAPFILHFAVQPYRWGIRASALGTFLLAAFIVYLTNSRIGSIGFLIAILIYGFFWAFEKQRQGRGDLLGAAVLALYPVAAVTALVATLVVGRLRRLVWGGGETQASTLGRLEQMRLGIPLIEKNPFGYGMGRAAETLNYHEPGGLLTIDSFYLGTVLEFGWIGFLMYFATWGFAIYEAGRMILRTGQKDKELSFLLPAMIALVNFLVIKSVFSQQDNHPFAYMLLGLSVALLYRAKQAEASKERSSARFGAHQALAAA